MTLRQKLIALPMSTGFNVSTEAKRRNICRLAKELRESGKIQGDVKTHRDWVNGGYKVVKV